ncbi:MAG: MFS transporter [Burkholderiaceae bacterium]
MLISYSTTFICAAFAGLLVSNFYYFQPLAPYMAKEMGWSLWQATSFIPVSQAGYCLGLLFLVPLADRVESRQLILRTMAAVVACLLALVFLRRWELLLLVTLCLGFCLSAIQMLLPAITGLRPAEKRGQTLGIMIAGIGVAVTLARPLASLAGWAGHWQTIFLISAGLMALGILTFAQLLPRMPRVAQGSLWHYMRGQVSLWRNTPLLRHRAFGQAISFGVFSAFWTGVPAELVNGSLGLSQLELGAFSLVAITATVAAPIAGRWSDQGRSQAGIGWATVILAVACLIAALGLVEHREIALLGLTLAAGLLDFGLALQLVLSQRQVFDISPQASSRANSLFMATFFTGGAAGSWAGGWVYSTAGWGMLVMLMLALSILGLAVQRSWNTSALSTGSSA